MGHESASLPAVKSDAKGPAHAPGRVLVIVTRRIGDVLLAVPLIRSLKSAWPGARVDVLVFEGTGGVLAGNPDIGEVICVPAAQRATGALRFARRIWRGYDLALSTSPSDRPTLYAWLAGKFRIGVMAPGAKHAWKRALLHGSVAFDDFDSHTLVQNLRLADLLGVPRRHEIPLGGSEEDEQAVENLFPGWRDLRLAVLHLYPKFTYKMWNPGAWRELAKWLSDRGFTVVLSGSGESRELRYVNEFADVLAPRPVNLAGKLGFPQLVVLLRRAALYVGPDTVTTHLAAAAGTPTVALFGPSNPVKWGPWPRGCDASVSPYSLHGSQFVGNVALVQGGGACVPCMEEGCARHVQSESVCLQMLTAKTVVAAVETLLSRPAARPQASA